MEEAQTENHNGLNTSKFMFWKPRRVRNRKQLERLITTEDYARLYRVSIPAVKYQIKYGKVWATKIGNRRWIDPTPDIP